MVRVWDARPTDLERLVVKAVRMQRKYLLRSFVSARLKSGELEFFVCLFSFFKIKNSFFLLSFLPPPGTPSLPQSSTFA